jgi:predicted short-subunit dehydrogenase-like oxidoreductase (DUF2520 family)
VRLTVSDSAIEAAAGELRPVPGVLVAHTSGSRPAATLEGPRSLGADIGGFHPLAAVVRPRDNEGVTPDVWTSIFRGAAFAIEGIPPVQARLIPLARALGGHPFPIAAADKPLYHLGASMLAAFSAGLAQIAWDEMRAAGAPVAVASAGTGHLLRTVGENIARGASPASVLTGPVARGDAGGVSRQADATRGLSAEAQAIYRVHVEHNLRLAREAGRVNDQAADAILAVLRDAAPAQRNS